MDFYELAPFLIPAVILQIFVSGYFVHQCITHPTLDKWTKLKYALAIAIFNLPAAAFYLLKVGKINIYEDISKGIFRNHVRQANFAFIVIAYEILVIRTIANHMGMEEFGPLVWISALGLFVMILTEILIQYRQMRIAYGLSVVLVICAFLFQLVAADINVPYLVIIISASMINNYPLKPMKYFIGGMILGFIITQLSRSVFVDHITDMDEVVSMVYLNGMILTLILSVFYMLKKFYVINDQLNITVATIENQNQIIKELSATEERNRIAKEIHDTVGHRLTGALYLIESASLNEMKVSRNESLSKAYELIKHALDDIRHSVKLLVEDSSIHFEDKLIALKEQIESHTGLVVEMDVQLNEPIPSVFQRLLIQIFMECCTNTVKHAKTRKAHALITHSNHLLLYSFTDDGSNTDEVTFGFGLSTMKESVESFGGKFDARSGQDGFTISIQLPLLNQLGGSHDE